MQENGLEKVVLDLIKQNERMEFAILKLHAENKRLQEENAHLREMNAGFLRTIQELKAANDKLQDMLNLNSNNSGKPPSTDLKRKKREKKKSSRKAGGQHGHKYNKRELSKADEVVECSLDSLRCKCGGEIILGEDKVHQRVEIPPIKPYVTEYRIEQGICSCCHKQVTSKLPAGVSRDILGSNTKSIITSLSGFFGNSKREVQQILKSIFNLDISLGLISNTEKRVSARCLGEYERIRDKLEDSSYLHLDETSHRNCGKKGWAWIMSNKEYSLLHLSNSRGKKVLEGLLPEYEGIVISDRYAAYNYFSNDNRQVCWSHLARDFERFAGSVNPLVSEMGKRLKYLSDLLFSVYKGYREEKIDYIYFLRKVRKIKKKIHIFLKKISRYEEAKQASRIAKNLLKVEDLMWRFLGNTRLIDPTNNLAERQIRKYVLYRKKSLFTWSTRGEQFIERALSIFLSCRLQNINPVFKLQSLIA